MWNAISQGLELVSPCPIPATITISPLAPPFLRTVRFMWSRNTVSEISHISFYCGGTLFVKQSNGRRTLWGADRSAWVTSWSLPSLKRPVDLSPSLDRPADLFLPSKITKLILSFKSHEHASSPMYFSVYGRLSECTYFGFFPGNLFILFANRNMCHSIHWQ